MTRGEKLAKVIDIEDFKEQLQVLPSRIEEDRFEYSIIRKDTELIIDILTQISKHQSKHELEAATKADLSKTHQAVLNSLTQQNEELRACVNKMKEHIDSFSPRRISIIFSTCLLILSLILVIITFFNGSVEIHHPLPDFLLIFSIGIYLMSIKLPKKE